MSEYKEYSHSGTKRVVGVAVGVVVVVVQLQLK